ncbi:MAG: C-GCAxxG-C-C family protein [Anaerovoracaceae bacterium]
MKNRVETALENHKKGYNCAQAVACAFADKINMDEKELFRITEAMGFGMGTMGTCGAVSAMAVVIGLLNSDGNLEQPGTKRSSYKMMKEMTKAFEEKNQSVICREIKGVDSGNVLRSCDGCVCDAAEILAAYLEK